MDSSRMISTFLGTVAVLAAAALASPPHASAGDWTWPVEGRVLTPYVNDNARPYAGGMHRGIDIGAASGAPVVAAHAGEVTFAGAVGSSGQTISLRSADGRYLTSYLHLGRIDVARGASVDVGERIGAVGTSGRRTLVEPHLHFGVRLADGNDRYVDPLSLLPALTVRSGSAPLPPAGAPAPARAQPAPVPTRLPPHGAPAERSQPVRGRTLRPLPAPRREVLRGRAPVPRALPVPAPAPNAIRTAHHPPRLVPAGPRAGSTRSTGSGAVGTPAAPSARVTGDRGVPAFEWGRIVFGAGAALSLLALLGRPARRAATGAKRWRRLRADRRRDGAHEPADSTAPEPAPRLLPQLN